MGVRIEQLNVESVGPISGLQLALGPFNLIYGQNEQGKTLLVEFLIRSLFKNLSGWALREADCRGKIVVSGLDNEPLTLMPSSRSKLEDYLAGGESGMPARISHLLVVKGAELTFTDGKRQGINRDVLKEFLSGQGVLDGVRDRISKTVQGAQVVDGRISGARVGEIRARNNLSSSLEGIDDLFEQIEALYSGAERGELQARIEELEAAIAAQEQGRRHQAFLIDQQIRRRRKILSLLPQAEVDKLQSGFKQLQESQNRIDRQEIKLAELAEQSEHYPWLEEAISLYEGPAKQSKIGTGPVYPLVIGLSLLLAILTSLLNYTPAAVGFIVLAALFGWLYLRQYRWALDHAPEIEEIKKIEAEYQRRFGQPLTGLSQLKTKKKSMEEAYHGSKTLSDELDQERENLASLKYQTATRLQRLAQEIPKQAKWEESIRKLLQRRGQVQERLNQNQVALAALGVPEGEYRAEPAAVEFSQETLQALNDRLALEKERLKEKTAELAGLKQRISQSTGDDIAAGWETLIQNLQRKREEISAEYRGVTASILAGILVNEQLDVIRAQVEEKIRSKLASPLVSAPIHNITRRYSGVRYEDEKVWLTDDYGQFRLSDLSTGAREQVLLGLRLGFAAHILGHDQLFLILDDAFQHADWRRREWLLNQTIGLAQDGWQIIYFTMDDHIKNLFDAAGRRVFDEQYRSYVLNSTA